MVLKNRYQKILVGGLVSVGLFACNGDDRSPDPTTVEAGSRFQISEGENKQLTPSFTLDKTRSVASYNWRQISGPAVTISDPTIRNPVIYAPYIDHDAEVILRLEVTDSDGTTVFDDLVFSIDDLAEPEVERPLAQPVLHSYVREGQTAELRGTGTVYQGESPISGYQWTQVSGPQVTLAGADSEILTFSAPEVLEDTTLAFDFVVRNGAADSVPLRYSVTVTNMIKPGIANAGSDSTCMEGDTVTLTGSASVLEHEPAITGYNWTQVSGPQVSLSAASTAQPSFVAPEVDKATNLVFQLVASNGAVSPADSVTVTVNNRIPVAEAGALIEVVEGESFTLDGAGSSQNGDRPLTRYTWRSLSSQYAAVDSTSDLPTRTLTAAGVDVDTDFQFGLIVADSVDTSIEDLVTVRVKNGGDVPTVVAADLEVSQKTQATLDASASSDPKNRSLLFSWEQVVADEETPVELTLNGASATFTAPSVDEDTELLFNVTASNGVNTSEPYQVKVLVKSAETYAGSLVQLKGNPFTTHFDSLDVGYHLYDVEVVGTKAYATYHERKKNADGVQPTGLLVIDISDEQNLTIEKNYPIQWEGSENAIAVQMKLAVDAEQQYAYVVEPDLVNNEEEAASALGLLRINLASDPLQDNGEMYYLPNDIEFEGSAGDVVIRGGRIFVSTYNDQSIVEINPTADPANAVSFLWTPDSSYSSNLVQGLDVSADGTAAVIVDNKQVQVVRFGEGQSQSFKAQLTGSVDESWEGTRYVSIDGNAEFAYISFVADLEDNEEHPYSAVEKIDIRSPEGVAPEYFQTTEDARGIAVEGNTIYVAGGKQGLQLVENKVVEDAAAMSLRTYYQTPAAAIEVSVNVENNRAYVVGDTTFSIIDLTSQDTPAEATAWGQDYLNSERTDFPGVAQDVEIVLLPELGEYAVVAQGADPEGFNNLFMFNIVSESLNERSIDISAQHSNDDVEDGKMRLKASNGHVFGYFPFNNDGAFILANDQFAAVGPVVNSFADSAKIRSIGFASDTAGFMDYESGFNYGEYSLAINGAEAVVGDHVFHNDNFYEQFISETQTRVVATGKSSNGGERWGCVVKDLGGSGSTASTLVFELPEATQTYSGAYDADRYICFAGYGYQQPVELADIDEYADGYGILSVAFNNTVESLDVDPDSHSEKWEGNIDEAQVARTALYALPDNPEDLYLKGNRLYVANGTRGGIQILDVSDPTTPVLEGVLHTQDRALGVAVNSNETIAIVADDNMQGIVRIPYEFPTLERTDNDAEVAQLETVEEVVYADTHAVAGTVLTYRVDWSREEYDQVNCYASTDTSPFGDEHCKVTPVEDDPTAAILSWTLTEAAGQEVRVAVGNNIEFLSVNSRVFVTLP